MARRIVLFAEGEGEEVAAPLLLKRLLVDSYGPEVWAHVRLEQRAWRVGHLGYLRRDSYSEWRRLLSAAATRYARDLGGVCLLLDADRLSPQQCVRDVAREFVEQARQVGGGDRFSVVVVLACCEYESWILASAATLAGNLLPGGLPGLNAGASVPTGDLGVAPRDAKKWLSANMERPYKPTVHQAAFTQLLDLAAVRASGSRSFRRLESALREVVAAIHSGQPVATPAELPAS